MEDSDSIWQWCRARKKALPIGKIQSDGVFTVAKIGSLADGSCSNIPKRKQCRGDSPVRRSSTTFEGNALQSRAYCRKMCSAVQNSIPEVDLFKNGDSTESPVSVIQDHISSSETNSDTMSDHPFGIEGENPVIDLSFHQKKKASKSRVGRRGQKTALNSLLIKGSSGQYTACNRETSMEASSSCSISKVVAEDMQLHNREIRNLRLVSGSETSSSYIDWPCHPRTCKRPKRDQSLVSETGKSPFEIENQKAKSEILFPGLHLLADVAVRFLENDVARFPENSITEEKGIRKAIFIPTGVPFFQKRVPRRATSAFKRHQPYARQMLHDLEKNLSAANSEPLLTADNICKLGEPACIKQSENQVAGSGVDEEQVVIPQSRCSRRSRSQALPSKYCDSVLQPWKRGTRR